MTSSRSLARPAIVFVIFAVFCFVLTLTCVSAEAQAEVSVVTTKTIRIAQLSDTHLFIEDYCNLQSTAYKDAYYKNSKLMIESEAAVQAVLDDMYALDEPPLYVFVTGDLTSNGEKACNQRLAEIFAAFTDRMKVRAGYEGFQILVTPGNHDTYNNNSKTYMPDEAALLACANDEERKQLIASYADGKGAPSTTFADFVEIYAAFGYDQSKMNNKSFTLEFFYDSDYWYDDDFGLTIQTPSQDLIDAFEASDHDWSIMEQASRHGALSYIARCPDFTLVALDGNTHKYIGEDADPDTVTYNWTEPTGGYFSNAQLQWAIQSTRADAAAGKFLLTMAHENYLPHFDFEDEILSLFTFDNWRDSVEALADAGIKYGFSGHMHSSDVANYVTQQGSVFYDYEVGSPISFGCPYRTVDFVLKSYSDGSITEDMYSNVISIDTPVTYNAYEMTADGDVIIDNGVIKTVSLTTSDKDGNPQKLTDYLDNNIKNMVGNMASSFVNEGLYGMIGGLADGQSAYLSNIVRTLASELKDVDFYKPQFTADGITMSDAPVSGYDLVAFAEDVVDYLLNYDLSFGKVQGGYTAAQAVKEIYGGHMAGANPQEPSEAVAALADAAKSGKLVSFLVEMVSDLLFPQIELLFNTPIRIDLSKPALAAGEGIDLAAALNASSSGSGAIGTIISVAVTQLKNNNIDTLYGVLNYIPELLNVSLIRTTLEALGGGSGSMASIIGTVTEYLELYMEYDSLTDFVNAELIDKYVTDALCCNIGNYGAQILLSLATDATDDGSYWNSAEGYNVTNKTDFHVIYSEDAFVGHSYQKTSDGDKLTVVPTAENGLMPSMLSLTLGENVYTDRNFVWYTAIAVDPFEPTRLETSYIEYRTAEGSFTRVKATSENVVYPIPNIDLGILYFNLTNSVKQYNKFSVSLKGLTAGTYYYRVGSDAYGWTPIHTFTLTAQGNTLDFMAITDIQGSVEDNYLESAKYLYSALLQGKTPAFILDGGDNVDNGENINQWGWLLNCQTDVWTNYALITAAGNHEDDGTINEVLAQPEGAVQTTGGAYYSYTMNGVHFAVINTNDLSADGSLSLTQTDWLTEDLESAQSDETVNWTIVLMHKGPYTAGSHAYDKDVTALRAQLTPLFAEYGVDLVLQGHDHTYSVSEYIDGEGNAVAVTKDDRNAAVNPQSVLYVNMGTIGDKFYDYIYNDEVSIIKRDSVGGAISQYLTADGMLELTETPVFLSVSVTEHDLTVTSYTFVNGRAVVVDSIIISDHAEYDVFPTGAIVGIVFGGIGALMIIAVGVVLLISKKVRK